MSRPITKKMLEATALNLEGARMHRTSQIVMDILSFMPMRDDPPQEDVSKQRHVTDPVCSLGNILGKELDGNPVTVEEIRDWLISQRCGVWDWQDFVEFFAGRRMAKGE